jgi:hypothetical protein
MKTEQELLEGIKNAREGFNRLSALLDAVKTDLQQLRAELAKLKWTGLAVGKTVRMPDGKRYVVYSIHGDAIEDGYKPWIRGIVLKKDGSLSNRKHRALFDDWTVEL